MMHIANDKYYQLKRFLRLVNVKKRGQDKYHLTFGYYPDSTFEIECDSKSLHVLLNLKKPVTKNKLYEYFSKTKTDITYNDIDCDIEHLIKMGMIESYQNEPIEENRYDRHLIYYSMFSNESRACQRKLRESTVVLLGVGGIGSWLAYCLVGSGVGAIIGVDHDDIELTNLTRQILYNEDDIGKIKVEVAAERLKKFNSETRFIPINKKIETANDIETIIKGADLVLLSADKPAHIGFMVNEACASKKIPWSVTGYIEMHGVCGPLIIPGKTACLNCVAKINNPTFDFLDETQKKLVDGFNRRYQAPSYGPFNCYLSGLQAMEAVKYLTGYEKPRTVGTRFLINSKDMKIQIQRIHRNPKCEICRNI